jgi:hypothetical protein
MATVQLNRPSGVAVGFGSIAGSISITASASNGPPGQTYAVVACTDMAMTLNCVTASTYTLGDDFTGLAYTVGSAGTKYYVVITANASTGYFASSPSAQVNGLDTSQVGAPGKPTVAPGNRSGSIVVTFLAAPGAGISSYTVMACTDTPAMTQNCVTKTNYTSGSRWTGLVSGRTYFVKVTAVGAAGFDDNSVVSAAVTAA